MSKAGNSRFHGTRSSSFAASLIRIGWCRDYFSTSLPQAQEIWRAFDIGAPRRFSLQLFRSRLVAFGPPGAGIEPPPRCIPLTAAMPFRQCIPSTGSFFEPIQSFPVGDRSAGALYSLPAEALEPYYSHTRPSMDPRRLMIRMLIVRQQRPAFIVVSGQTSSVRRADKLAAPAPSRQSRRVDDTSGRRVLSTFGNGAPPIRCAATARPQLRADHHGRLARHGNP